MLLQACSMGGQRLKEADSLANVNNNEIIVVGTIELTPKLAHEEQLLNPPGVLDLFGYAKMNRNRAMIQFNSQPEASNYKYLITPELGKTFFFTIPRDMNYMVEGSVVMELSTRGVSGKIQLPTWFKLDIKPDDRAVYIGKLKYERDDFNSIIGMELLDDYKNAAKQFKKKFGRKHILRKSLIKKISS